MDRWNRGRSPGGPIFAVIALVWAAALAACPEDIPSGNDCNESLTPPHALALLTPASVTLDPGERAFVTVEPQFVPGRCAYVASTPHWSSDDETVVFIESKQQQPSIFDAITARIEGARGGVTRVRVEVSSVEAVVDVTVNPSTITVDPSPIEVDVGTSADVTATPADSDGSTVDVPVSWAIANTNVATVSVDAQGTATVTGLAPGNTQLTATAGSKAAQAPVHVLGQAQPLFLYGTMFGGDGIKPLAGILVKVGGVGSDVTDVNGDYRIDVTPGGSLTVSAQGVCDIDPVHLCMDELSFNSTELVTVDAPPGGGDVEYNPSAQTGYYLAITSGAQSLPVTTGATVQLQLGYRVWSREGLPGAAPRMVVGIEEDGQFVQVFGVPGAEPGVTGVADVTLTAPANPGTYSVYAYLTSAAGYLRADSIYEVNFQSSKTSAYIRMFDLSVQ